MLISDNITCLSESELDSLIRLVIDEYDNGNILVGDPVWDVSGSIFFAATVMTTIGYGHITLATSGGRAFAVFFAIFGIPLCLTMLAEVGIRLSQLGQRLDKRLNKGLFPRMGQYFRPVLITIIGTVLFILIPALIMTRVEDWDYGTAVYYGFVTLTTVGFGDVVAGYMTSYMHMSFHKINVKTP